jgi:hypothetical protein
MQNAGRREYGKASPRILENGSGEPIKAEKIKVKQESAEINFIIVQNNPYFERRGEHIE